LIVSRLIPSAESRLFCTIAGAGGQQTGAWGTAPPRRESHTGLVNSILKEMTMSQLTGGSEAYAAQYADLDELLGTQQLWARDRQLAELNKLYGEKRVADTLRHSPGLEPEQVAALLQAG
jgi:hypothetical protein